MPHEAAWAAFLQWAQFTHADVLNKQPDYRVEWLWVTYKHYSANGMIGGL